MKKVVAMFVVVSMFFCLSLPCFAHDVDSKELGVSFTLPNDWILEEKTDDSVGFYHRTNQRELIMIEAVDAAEWAWSMDFADENAIKQLCDEWYSNTNLAQNLSEQNGVYVTVKTDSVLTSFETYNNVKYFRYEKAYTASAYGYYDTAFYETMFVTAKNGKVYFISYQRDTDTNHFADVVSMLDGISFENGEIKIEIDNVRIHPDSAPMIIAERTLVPIRAVAEKMGYTVGWDGEQQLVTLTSEDDDTVIQFTIGLEEAVKKGGKSTETIELEVAPMIVEGRTYIPLRAAAEAMEADVNWDGAGRIVEITQK